MGHIFDPIRRREVNIEGCLSYVLKTSFDSARPMGNVAYYNVQDVIEAWLVGLSKEIAPVLPRALEWIDLALENGEVNRFGPDPNAHKVTLNWAKAIGQWMYSGAPGSSHWLGHDDPGLWEKCRVHEEWRWRFEGRPWPTNEIVTYGLDDYLAFTIGAANVSKYEYGPYNEIYSAGIDMYERWTGKTGPVTLSGAMKPRDFGYALCLHYTAKQSFKEDELFDAGRRMLKANLQNIWLGGGQYIRAATWLKVVYGHLRGEQDPMRCILSAYDNMPKVAKPDFIS